MSDENETPELKYPRVITPRDAAPGVPQPDGMPRPPFTGAGMITTGNVEKVQKANVAELSKKPGRLKKA